MSQELLTSGALTEEHLRVFARDGYLVVPAMFDADEMKSISSWVDEVQSWPEAQGGAWKYFENTEDGLRLLSRVERIVKFHSEFRELTASNRMLGACAQLFGEPAVLFKDKINFKLPGAGGFDLHQDVQAGWNRYGSLHITVSVAIDSADLESGCLELVGGLHSRGLLGSEWEPLTEDHIKGANLAPIKAQPGDAVFFDSYAPHRSGPNRSQQQRRLLYVTYGKAADGDQMEKYYQDKFENYPPDIERQQGREYRYRV